MQKNILIALILLQACSISTQNEAMAIDKAQRLQQSQWQLIRYFNAKKMYSALPKHPASLEFSAGKVSGSTGCNRYFSRYQLGPINSLTLSQAGTTMMACPSDMTQQEQHYLKNLEDIHFYLIQNEQLQLLDAHQQVRLIFKIAPALTLQETVWQVTGINNGHGGVNSNAHTEKAVLQFTQDMLQGNSGCNTLSARYQTEDKQLKIGPIRSTRKYCRENGLMAQEKRLLKALAQVSHYKVNAKQLRLLSAEGTLMLSLRPKI